MPISALPKTQPYFTVEEYFAHEERADDRSEYYGGEIFALTGASVNHNRIARNLVTSLSNAQRSAHPNELSIDLATIYERVEWEQE